MLDKLHEECGVVGVYGHPEAAKLVYLGLYALQHRGQESAGICYKNEDSLLYVNKGLGLVKEVFNTNVFKQWADKNVVLVELDFPRRTKLDPQLQKQNQQLQQQ